jgi:hypothetical protein
MFRGSRRPCVLRRRSAAAWLFGSRVRIPLMAQMLVSCVCVSCVGIGLCDELITRLEESYRVCVCVFNCVWCWLLRHRKIAVLLWVHNVLCCHTVVSIVIRLEAGRYVFRILAGARDIFLLQNLHTCCWVHPTTYSVVTWGSFQGLKRQRREADCSLPFTAKVMNEWSYTSISLYACMACIGTTLLFLPFNAFLSWLILNCRSYHKRSETPVFISFLKRNLFLYIYMANTIRIGGLRFPWWSRFI